MFEINPFLIDESQSPENGSRLCKLRGSPAFAGAPASGSQSPENGSRLCKGGFVALVAAEIFNLVAIP
jgi:hypothetical protein